MRKDKRTAEEKLGSYTPNHIPASERVWNIVLSTILLTYGAFGIINDDLFIPGKRGPGTHYHGEPVWILFTSFVFAAANMMSVVVDHFDVRNNETNYKQFARTTQILGWVFFVLALVLDLFMFHKATSG